MKKILFFTALLAIFAVNTNAQQQVTKGSTHTYEVTDNVDYTFNWSATGGTSTDLSTETANSVDITWDGAAGTYDVNVYATSINNCDGDNSTLQVEIIAASIAWNVASADECPASDNNTVTPNTITADFTGIDGDWSFTYSIDGGADQTVNVTGPDKSYDLTLPAGLYNNATGTDVTHEVVITSLTTPDGVTFNYDGTEADAADHLFELKVYPKPTTSAITVQ